MNEKQEEEENNCNWYLGARKNLKARRERGLGQAMFAGCKGVVASGTTRRNSGH